MVYVFFFLLGCLLALVYSFGSKIVMLLRSIDERLRSQHIANEAEEDPDEA